MFRLGALRTLPRLVPAQRRLASTVAQVVQPSSVSAADMTGNEFLSEREHIKEHAGPAADLWRKITFYVAFPIILIGFVHVRNLEAAHAAHAAEHDHEEVEKVEYPYMTKRDKPYPWGMYTLFYNPHVNMDPANKEE